MWTGTEILYSMARKVITIQNVNKSKSKLYIDGILTMVKM